MSLDCDICFSSLDSAPGLDINPLLLPKTEAELEKPIRGRKRKLPCGKSTCLGCVSLKEFKELSSVVSYECGHLFHHYCLETWFIEKGIRSCPKCKRICVLKARRRIYISKNDSMLNVNETKVESSETLAENMNIDTNGPSSDALVPKTKRRYTKKQPNAKKRVANKQSPGTTQAKRVRKRRMAENPIPLN